MSEPLVSIVVPIYNAASFLRRTLDSICAQTYRNLEIIAVDDGSTDNSKAIVEEYAEKDRRIRGYSQKNKGAGEARNLGISLLTGKYVLFLDSDDLFAPEFVSQMLTRAEQTEADVVISNYVSIDATTGEMNEKSGINMDFVHRYMNPACCCPRVDAPKHAVQLIGTPSPWNKFFRVEFIRKHKLSFLSLTSTNDLTFVLSACLVADKVSYVDAPLISYHIWPNSLSHSRKRNIENTPIALLALYRFLKNKQLISELKNTFDVAVAQHLCWNLITSYAMPEEICAHIDKWSHELSVDTRYLATVLDSSVCRYLSLFAPEISLCLPESSASKQSELLSAVSEIVDYLPVRVLYAQEDEIPLPFEQICYPIAMPVQVPSGATTQERLKACRSVNLPSAELEIWPGCSPAPILKKLRQCRMKILRTRFKGFFSFSRVKRKALKARKRAIRDRMRSLKLLLEIVQS